MVNGFQASASILSEDYGASGRTRTDDLRITNALLYQLSYGSMYAGEGIIRPFKGQLCNINRPFLLVF